MTGRGSRGASATGVPRREQRARDAPPPAYNRRAKDAEILALRHKLAVLERQLHGEKIRFDPADRAFLAALLHRLPRDVLGRIRLRVRDTVLRWHRDLLARRHAARSRPKRAGRPPAVRSIRVLVLRLARENSTWAYRRIHGELLVLGVTVAASTVREILHAAGIDPAPERASHNWASFLRSQAEAILAAGYATPDRCARCPNQLPILTRSHTCGSTAEIAWAESFMSTSTPS